MKLLLQRFAQTPEYTVGRLYIDDKFFSHTMEDVVRDMPKEKKIMHKTAIPAGTYKIVVNRSPKFKRDLPLLLDVPYFEGIRIHRGNTARDSSGCVLVGINREKGKVLDSTIHELKLTEILKNAQNSGEPIEIEIRNIDYMTKE